MATASVPKTEGMDDNELAALCAGHEQRSVGYFDSEIATEQANAINYYYGKMDDLPALDGCSSVVDHTVAIQVDNAVAAVLKPFVSADEVVSFSAKEQGKEEEAEQATEYVNYVINCDNSGFLIFHDWFKDALLAKIGVVKVWWEDQTKNEIKTLGANVLDLEAYRASDQYLSEQDNGDGTYAVDMQHEKPDGRVRIEGIPPEEFLITPFTRSIDESPYSAHRPSNYTRSDLLELGFDEDIVAGLPAFAQAKNTEAREQARWRDEGWYTSTQDAVSNDPSRDVIGVIDEYVRVDYDGDGIAELRRVIRVNDVILFNEETDEAPFALLCPCPMPHKVYGRSVADQSTEGQKVATAITRQVLDNLYKSNNPRPVVGDRAVKEDGSTWDDINDSSPGAAIRVREADQLDWATVPFTAGNSFNMLEYIALGVEEQTGFQRKGNGLNPETLKKNSPDTATQASIEENSKNERAEMVARIFAETGVKRLFRLVLKLLVAHQPSARTVRLRNQWVNMDPSGWNPDMDLTTSVGLGVGNKAEQIAQADSVLATMAELQQTPFAYLIDAEKVHAALKRKFVATGIKNVDDYLNDPKQVQAPPPQPDPDMAKVQAQAQLQGQKQQGDQAAAMAEHQLAQTKAEAAHQLEMEKAAAKANLDLQIAQGQAALAQAKAEFEARLALQESAQQAQIDMLRLQLDAAKADHAAGLNEQKIKQNRPGGDLSK